MPILSMRVLHEHASDPDVRRRLGEIELALQTILQRLSALAHSQARIEAEIVGMRDEMQSEIEKINDGDPQPAG